MVGIAGETMVLSTAAMNIAIIAAALTQRRSARERVKGAEAIAASSGTAPG
jgi:hypothetical protein